MKCNVYKKCGSCQYINSDYNEQLNVKYKDYQSLYKDFKCDVHPVVGMNHPYGYRNKLLLLLTIIMNMDYMKKITIRLFLHNIVYYMMKKSTKFLKL